MYVYTLHSYMRKCISLLILFFFSAFFILFGQNTTNTIPSFILKGTVVNADDNTPIARVNIEITGKGYTTTATDGTFSIKAAIGDELVIRSDDFKTVYYTIESKQRITVKVEKLTETQEPLRNTFSRKGVDYFKVYIDSAKGFLKKDAKKSIEYVTKALEGVPGSTPTKIENSIAFETLGDINMYWQLPDLAISNYKQSNSFKSNDAIQIKLAQAFTKNNNYQESIETYQNILKSTINNYQKIEVYEGLGDNYKATGNSKKSIENYQKGLSIAISNKISPKVTDLNSKIAEVYARDGAIEEAQEYFNNSLVLSKKENKKRAAEEKNKVADFYSQKQDFNKEITLRKETLSEMESIENNEDLEENLNSPLTPQRQNYKIANAYLAQNNYGEAINFLEKSIEEAATKEDLIVQKDATRKLSELYRDIGNYDKASESYESYVKVVDELYIKKEQELSQAARFNKEIALKQNRIISLENERALNETRYKLTFENQSLIEKNNTIQKWIIVSLVAIALLLLFTAYTQRKNVKQQKFANNILALKSLRTQMNPHFIFNALNSVNSFIATNDERAANKYLSEFSQLMRSVLENSEEDFIPLSKEIELLELYTKLEHFRFKDKFDYKITIDTDIPIDDFVIPPMLLQPYVENAVWHGLRYKEEKGMLEINFKQKNSETLLITIEDNGIGRKKSKELKTEHQKKQQSKGMGNIQKRITILNQMYKDKVTVFLEDALENGEGTLVTLTLKKD